MKLETFTQILVLLAWTGALGCEPTGEVRYTHERDSRAMEAILGVWEGPEGVTLTLCEDVARAEAEEAAAEPNGWCQLDHVVRGDDQGREHTEDHGGAGCVMGGCPYMVKAFVRGEIQEPAGAAVPVLGEVGLQSGTEDDPYAFPYRLGIHTDEEFPDHLGGTIVEDGSFTVESGTIVTSGTFVRTGDATCE